MPAIGPRSEWLPRPYISHFLTNKSIFYRGDPMANRKNSHRRRVRVAVLMVPVSYTHLDVYKRQALTVKCLPPRGKVAEAPPEAG